jgi:hypothetical protein
MTTTTPSGKILEDRLAVIIFRRDGVPNRDDNDVLEVFVSPAVVRVAAGLGGLPGEGAASSTAVSNQPSLLMMSCAIMKGIGQRQKS